MEEKNWLQTVFESHVLFFPPLGFLLYALYVKDCPKAAKKCVVIALIPLLIVLLFLLPICQISWICIEKMQRDGCAAAFALLKTIAFQPKIVYNSPKNNWEEFL